MTVPRFLYVHNDCLTLIEVLVEECVHPCIQNIISNIVGISLMHYTTLTLIHWWSGVYGLLNFPFLSYLFLLRQVVEKHSCCVIVLKNYRHYDE